MGVVLIVSLLELSLLNSANYEAIYNETQQECKSFSTTFRIPLILGGWVVQFGGRLASFLDVLLSPADS
jgi:hypothetical protein